MLLIYFELNLDTSLMNWYNPVFLTLAVSPSSQYIWDTIRHCGKGIKIQIKMFYLPSWAKLTEAKMQTTKGIELSIQISVQTFTFFYCWEFFVDINLAWHFFNLQYISVQTFISFYCWEVFLGINLAWHFLSLQYMHLCKLSDPFIVEIFSLTLIWLDISWAFNTYICAKILILFLLKMFCLH